MSKKFIAWGVKLHSHTHSYIHAAYYKAFKYLGYDVYHFDENDDVSNFDFSNSIFLTAGICDNKIPLIKNAKYILHNCDLQKYNGLDYLILQVYTTDISEQTQRYKEEEIEKLDTFILYSDKKRILYQPWATDLLPHEIETEYIHLPNRQCIWIGSIWGGEHGNYTELLPFFNNCQRLGYHWKNINPGQCSFEQNKELVLLSEIAPAINGEWQKLKHYIPCRIFKNISYGKIGLTNNEGVYTLLEGHVIYDNSNTLLDKYMSLNINELHYLFNKSALLVKEKHTYLNRINNILKVL